MYFNQALLGKWLWRFGQEGTHLWWRVVATKYGEGQGGWNTKVYRRAHGCGLWCGINEGWESFSKHLALVVGDGSRILFLHDKWVMDNLGCTDTPFLASCRCQTRVGHWYGYDSPDSGVRRVSLFFCFSDTALTRLRRSSDTPAMEKKKIHKCLTSHLCPLPLPSVARRS